ncbi:glycoside hydrolase family 13 protein [Sporolactobacillus sp. THM7-4]|nr:glycoside hydrolase family 13 protein [Sporolactobacillus sp. THM7-4]
MDQPSVYFNSWSEKYRRPFGSIRIGASVWFTVRVNLQQVIKVTLVIQKDGEAFQEFQMTPGTSCARCYKLEFRTDGESGLYFYHFKIEYKDQDGQNKIIYYGKAGDGFGGQGEVVYDMPAVRQYQLTCYDHPDPAPDWYLHGVVYHIFVDRFKNGNRHGTVLNPKKNSFIYATESDTPYYIRDKNEEIARWDFFGGNLQGIIVKLPYLHRLGVTVLYLSPIFEARSNHKYDTADYRRIDPMFGEIKTFQKLIAKAGRLGIHIILDGVFNHVGADSRYFNRFKTYGDGGAYHDPHSPYFNWFTFRHYPDDYDCWWNVRDLPTVNKDNPMYQDFIYRSPNSIIHMWMDMGIGGWRLDVADELPDEFIRGIRSAVDQHNKKNEGKVVIGEVWEDASNKVAYGKRRHYLEGGILHGVMNYPFRSLIINLLLERTPAIEAVRASLTLKSNYPPEAFRANLNNIGTHDTERILTVLNGDEQKMRLAIWLLMTLPGVPCIYYGDEAGLTGGKDPDNRRFFPWGRENKTIEASFRAAVQARRSNRDLVDGDYLPFSAGRLFGFIRYCSEDSFTIIIVNPTPDQVAIDLKAITDPTGEEQISKMVGELFAEGTEIAPVDFILKIKEKDQLTYR